MNCFTGSELCSSHCAQGKDADDVNRDKLKRPFKLRMW